MNTTEEYMACTGQLPLTFDNLDTYNLFECLGQQILGTLFRRGHLVRNVELMHNHTKQNRIEDFLLDFLTTEDILNRINVILQKSGIDVDKAREDYLINRDCKYTSDFHYAMDVLEGLRSSGDMNHSLVRTFNEDHNTYYYQIANISGEIVDLGENPQPLNLEKHIPTKYILE